MSIAQIKDWDLVPADREMLKYERYALFYKAFINLTPKEYKADAESIVSHWIKIAKNKGIDIATSIFNDYCEYKINPNLEESLLKAIQVITDGNYSYNSPAEIKQAHNIALNLYKNNLNNL